MQGTRPLIRSNEQAFDHAASVFHPPATTIRVSRRSGGQDGRIKRTGQVSVPDSATTDFEHPHGMGACAISTARPNQSVTKCGGLAEHALDAEDGMRRPPCDERPATCAALVKTRESGEAAVATPSSSSLDQAQEFRANAGIMQRSVLVAPEALRQARCQGNHRADRPVPSPWPRVVPRSHRAKQGVPRRTVHRLNAGNMTQGAAHRFGQGTLAGLPALPSSGQHARANLPEPIRRTCEPALAHCRLCNVHRAHPQHACPLERPGQCADGWDWSPHHRQHDRNHQRQVHDPVTELHTAVECGLGRDGRAEKLVTLRLERFVLWTRHVDAPSMVRGAWFLCAHHAPRIRACGSNVQGMSP